MRTSDSITLRVACRTHDWTNALFEGKVSGGPFALEMIDQENVGAEGLLGPAPVAEYAECGLAGLIEARVKGAPVRALPIFIRTTFRHSYILVRTDRGIEQPKDLEGKRIGTNYNTTATVWIRGMLQHGYGVALEKIHWLDQGPAADYHLPPGMVMERVERGVNLHDWLRDGRIDGLITYNAELIHFLGDSRVKRLFPNAAQDERDWWPRTHLMPMMNVIACTEETLKNRPAETRAVFDAFVQAKEMGLKAVLNNRTSGLVWYWQAVEDQLLILGRDPIPYSVEKNRPAMEALFSYCVEQGLVDRKLDVDDLFFSGFDS